MFLTNRKEKFNVFGKYLNITFDIWINDIRYLYLTLNNSPFIAMKEIMKEKRTLNKIKKKHLSEIGESLLFYLRKSIVTYPQV